MTEGSGIVQWQHRLLPLADEDTLQLDGLTYGAVLVLLYPRDGSIWFPLTIRPETLRRHPGQISLPGGRAEPGDFSLWDAALRETEEELGIPGPILPLGRLDPIQVAVTGYLVVPFVGWIASAPVFRPDPQEVAGVFEVSLDMLLDPSLVGTETRELRGTSWDVTYFLFGGHRVWGATARILADLRSRVVGTSIPDEPVPGSVFPAAEME